MSYFESRKFAGFNTLETGEYENCEFTQCTFSGEDFSKYKFINCTFKDCDLSNVKVKAAIFNTVIFQDCKLTGILFGECTALLFSIACIKCNLRLASFFGCKLKSSSFNNCSLKEVDFTEADCQNVQFKGCDLEGATFESTNLENADFTTAYNFVLDPEKNRMKKSRFAQEGLPGLLMKYQIVISS